MDVKIENVSHNILELGLGALAHANRHAAYYDIENDKWEELTIIQAAHAAELLVKARIAQEHPLLIFEDLPSVSNQEALSLNKLAEEGRTIGWSDLPKVFKPITGCNFIREEYFNKFGKMRNSLQHFGVISDRLATNFSLETLKFIYSFIDPFINQHWDLCAIDYDEDMDSYEHLPITLIDYEIEFIVSTEAAKHSELWQEALSVASVEYQHKMGHRIKKALGC